MSDNTQLVNTQLLAAAAVMAGPEDEGWEQRVMESARKLKVMSSPGSRMMKMLAEFDGVSEDGSQMKIKHFTGVVLGIKREESSTRGVVSLYTGTDRNPRPHPITKVATPGVEHVRTERTDSKTDTIAKDLANHISRDLIGHRVNCTVKLESVKGKDYNVRVLIAVQDLGVSDDKQALALLG